MPSPLNAQAAEAARVPLEGLELPETILEATDHLAVLRWTVQNAISRLGDVEAACTASEVACARISEPSPEIGWLLDGAQERGSQLAIVSNNSEDAVRTFLDRFDWSDRFAAFACRTPETSRLLKPNPFLVTAATRFLEMTPGDCVFIGDSVSDVQAGHAASGQDDWPSQDADARR